MKHIFLCIAAFLLGLACLAQTSFGNATLFDDGWKFRLGDDMSAIESGFDDSGWESVAIPHDWSVKGHLSPDLASGTGYLPGGIGWYRKTFDGRGLSSENVFIYFEGVYNRSSVWLNGHLLGERPSGYASFLYDLTPFLNREGENIISVRVDHSRYADSRWYNGSGIYRDVWLVASGPVHFSLWGVGYNAEVSDSGAIINVDTAIEGTIPPRARLELVLKDAGGAVVARASAKAAASGKTAVKVRSPHRWSLEDPYLYSLEAVLTNGKEVIDRTSIPVGLRTLEFSSDKGFALNGQWIKVKGVCLHHDAGVLGACVPPEVWKDRLITLKSLGVNAIRTSHNPQIPLFYDLCDRLGFLVMDEAFDEWEFAKKKWVKGWNVGIPAFDGTFDFFEEWGERDLADMVRRDRNHPCIFMWSIGNEVDYPNDPYSHPILDGGNEDFTQPVSGGYDPDAPDASRIGKIAERLAACVRKVDTSRPVTGALAGVAMSNQTTYPEAVDVVGYNYTESRYKGDHEKYPSRIIYGSENRHDYRAWTAVRDNDFIFGQFLWTGADYLGEAREWPSRGSSSGLLDLCSFVKPRGWFRASLWSEKPVCYVGAYRSHPGMRHDSMDAWDDWNFEEGEMIHVVCYTNGAGAALFLDGKMVGDMQPYDSQDGIISWDIPFHAGTLKAVAYDDKGMETSSCEMTTSLRPYSLEVTSEGTPSIAGGTTLLRVDVLDDNGVPVKLADNEIRCRIDGPAELLGMENGNPSDMTDYSGNVRRAFRGRIRAYVRRTAPGPVSVTFYSPLLKSACVDL